MEHLVNQELMENLANQVKKGSKGIPGDRHNLATLTGQPACTGPCGPKGNTGAKGQSGRQGPEGTQGISGKDGRTGRDGADGKSGTGTPGKEGGKGPSGLRGQSGRATKVGLPGAPGEFAMPQIDVIMNMMPQAAHINFYAALSTNFKGVTDTIKYDVVLNNDGDGYNERQGCFVAPTDGIYFFMTNALRCQKSGPLYIHLMKNQQIVSSTSNLDDTFESCSASVFLNLSANDIVWVKLRVGQVYGHTPSHYTNFMGYRTANLTPQRAKKDIENIPLSKEQVGIRLAEYQVAAAIFDSQAKMPFEDDQAN